MVADYHIDFPIAKYIHTLWMFCETPSSFIPYIYSSANLSSKTNSVDIMVQFVS